MVFIDFDLHIPQTHVIWRALWVSKVGLDFKDVSGALDLGDWLRRFWVVLTMVKREVLPHL